MLAFVDLPGNRPGAGGDFGVFALGGLFERGQGFLSELPKPLACLLADFRAVIAELFDERGDLIVGAEQGSAKGDGDEAGEQEFHKRLLILRTHID
jgi:hypothetical protein